MNSTRLLQTNLINPVGMEYVSGDNFNMDNKRVSYCILCEKQTEQRIEERVVSHHKGASSNPRFDKAHFEDQLCWWCDECEEHVNDISLGKY